MWRYARLYACCLRFSFSKALQFRLDFYFRVVMDCVFYAVQILFFGLLYRYTDVLGGWDESQVRVFVAGLFLVDALHMTVFANNMWWLPIYINRGDVDYYLVRPVSSLFLLSLRQFAANSFVNLIIASGILVWALWSYPGELGPLRVLVYLLLLANGCVLHWILHMFFIVPVFWTHSETGLRQLFYGLEKLGQRPDEIFTGFVRRLLTSIVPFAIIVSWPTHVLFEGLGVARIAHILAVTAVMFLLLVRFWRRALRAYSSASS